MTRKVLRSLRLMTSQSSAMRRREFLSLCGLAAGSCLVPNAVARLIHETCVLSREPYLLLPRDPRSTLFALSSDGRTDFMLHLGDPFEEEKLPTWRQYFDEYECIDIRDKSAVEEWWREQVGDPEDDPITIQADQEIDGAALARWETHQELFEGPSASAFRYLERLQLDDGRGLGEGNPLGELRFIEGDRPGSNLTYVEAPDLASLACLQNRLNELDENLAIRIKKW
jgi:hypothetical protein